MKLTKTQLRQIIKEELTQLNEASSKSLMSKALKDVAKAESSLSGIGEYIRKNMNYSGPPGDLDVDDFADLMEGIKDLEDTCETIRHHSSRMGI